MQVSSAADAVRMENDEATAWRAVIEHAETADNRGVRFDGSDRERGDGHPRNRVLGAGSSRGLSEAGTNSYPVTAAAISVASRRRQQLASLTAEPVAQLVQPRPHDSDPGIPNSSASLA